MIVIPIRIHTNLKAEILDEFELKKKGLHTSAFKYRIEELRCSLRDIALRSRRVIDERTKGFQLDAFIESIIDKVRAIFNQFPPLRLLISPPPS